MNTNDLAELIWLNDVPDLLPRHRGKKIHLATLYRWAMSGRLRCVKIGGRLYTTREAIAELARPVAPRPRQQRLTNRGRAAEEKWAARVLDEAGIR